MIGELLRKAEKNAQKNTEVADVRNVLCNMGCKCHSSVGDLTHTYKAE